MIRQLDLFANQAIHRGPPTAQAAPSSPAIQFSASQTPGDKAGGAENQTSGILRGSPNCERLVPDICAGKHGGNEQSEAAHQRGASGRAQQKARVLAEIEKSGRSGLTCKELAVRWGVMMHHISGRFSELKADGEIWQAVDEDGKKIVRDGCAAMRV